MELRSLEDERVVILPESEDPVKKEDEMKKEDPFALVNELQDTGPAWSELDNFARLKRVVTSTMKFVSLLMLLYLFICTLSFLSSSFRLLGGKTAGEVFTSQSLISNPIAGLMMGVLVTVLVQSSSTSTSIVVAMVASKIIDVRPAIPIVMGANIGTSVTNTLVSLAQVHDRTQFRRAFAGAVVHDMFNLLCVVILLPLEVATGYLYKLTDVLVDKMNLKGGDASTKKEFLKAITKPFTKLIIQIDKKVIERIAKGDKDAHDDSLVKFWCDKGTKITMPIAPTTTNLLQNVTLQLENVTTANKTVVVHKKQCAFLFHNTGLSDSAIGSIMLFLSLTLLCVCLVLIVKLLNSMLRGHIANVIRKTINNDFRKPFGFLKGYFMILLGAGLTILVQSSSVFTSALTPLVGIGLVSLEMIFPLTLGSNIGTTVTGLLAALAVSGDRVGVALQIALSHLFFNISGILIWYPIPFMRRVPIRLAKHLGNTTATYRWFAPVYIFAVFFIIPSLTFALSLTGWTPFITVFSLIVVSALLILVINIMQSRCQYLLPSPLRTWQWLPLCCRSLEPHDRVIVRITKFVHQLRRNRSDTANLV